jgi:hypothetical protein
MHSDYTNLFYHIAGIAKGLYINKEKAANWSQSAGLSPLSKKLGAMPGEVLLKGGSPNIIIDDSDNARSDQDVQRCTPTSSKLTGSHSKPADYFHAPETLTRALLLGDTLFPLSDGRSHKRQA